MKNILILTTLLLSNFVALPIFADGSVYEASPIGLTEYQRSCAVCHGIDAKGKGIMADTLKKKPADLTNLSKRNGGHFPHQRVYQTIEGLDQLEAHGTREMPIWGKKYRDEARSKFDDEYLYLRGRMFELIIYLQSVQEY